MKKKLIKGTSNNQCAGSLENALPHAAPIDKAHHQLGWSPRWDFATTVARTVGWYRRVEEGAGLTAGKLPGRFGEPCCHPHPVMGACCCAA
jgi:hypothetical protein